MRSVLLAVTCLTVLAAGEAGAGAADVAGRSAEGRPIAVTRLGDPAAATTVLVVGSIHGTEPAGHAVVRALRRLGSPPGVRLLLVRTANPDGLARGTRQNARGVDLNRNFPFRWRGGGRPFDPFFPGPGPASEPETRVMQRLIRRERPDVTVWYHQALELVTLVPRADAGLIRLYGRRTGLPPRALPRYRGTATSWQNRRFAGTTAFVVELPAGPLGPTAARRHARAVLAVAARAHPATTPPPRIVRRPIPFGPRRRRQMRAYSRRHYGDDTARLRDPKVVVLHYTGGTTYESAWRTFAGNAPDPELGELPGVCAHFLIDRDGTITQLVPLKYRCRHTIGLNHVSLGIEHVGVSDGDVLGNRRMRRASLALTRRLQARFGIRARDVIGHAESLRSPYHHERVEALRTRTHADFAPATMRRYRARLRARARSVASCRGWRAPVPRSC